MRKLYIYIMLSIFCSNSVFSQIGILTDNPAPNTLLHIDAKADNSSGVPTVNKDDVVVDKSGNVGIGTIAPQSKLHIVTGGTSTAPNAQMKIEDGYQMQGRVLASDANGIGKWTDYIPGYQAGVVGAGISFNTLATNTTWEKTNMTIILDPGQWLVFFTLSMQMDSHSSITDTYYRVWVQVTLGDDINSTTQDAITKKRFSNNCFMGKRCFLNGWVGVNNPTSVAKKYTIFVGEIQNASAQLNLYNVGEFSDGYSNLYAFRINLLN